MKHIFATACLLSFLFLVIGCSITEKRMVAIEKNWGKAYETARFAQIVNPEADHDPMETAQLDGEAAEKTQKAYREMFKETEQASQVFNFSF